MRNIRIVISNNTAHEYLIIICRKEQKNNRENYEELCFNKFAIICKRQEISLKRGSHIPLIGSLHEYTQILGYHMYYAQLYHWETVKSSGRTVFQNKQLPTISVSSGINCQE